MKNLINVKWWNFIS